MKSGIAIATVALSTFAACALASPRTGTLANLIACSRLKDPGERLRCYDTQAAAISRPPAPSRGPSPPPPAVVTSAVPAPAAPATVASAVPAPAPASVPSAGTAQARQGAPPAQARTEPAQRAAAPSTAAANQSAAAQFGAEDLPRSLQPQEPRSAIVMHSTITAVNEVAPEVFVISLGNGQVWLQNGSPTTRFFRAGSAVRIEKGFLGSYHMTAPSVGSKNWVRVTRIR